MVGRSKLADEDERKVTRVGEPLLVEGERLLEIDLIDERRREWTCTRVVLTERRAERGVERDLRENLLVGEYLLQSACQQAESRRVGTRLREGEMNQLEHRLQVFSRGAAVKAFLGVADIGGDKRVGAGQDFVQVDTGEPAEATLGDHVLGCAGGDEILIAGEGRAAGLTALKRISSSLNVVGLSTTRTPLDNCHSVMPSASFADVLAIAPGEGSGLSSGSVLTVST